MEIKEPIVDPRLLRADLEGTESSVQLDDKEAWGTYEVFHQKKRGDQHVHAGIVHASDPEMALVFAKEQYGRRLHSANIWVVRTADVYSLGYDNEDMFETTPEKTYREAGGYKLRDKISDYKKEMAARAIIDNQHAGN